MRDAARTIPAIAMAAAIALPLSAPSPALAQAQQGPTAERMAQCFGLYHVARRTADGDPARFDNRLYHAGWALSAELRYSIAQQAGDMAPPDALDGQVAACDAEMLVTPAMIEPTDFDHQECGVRYSTMAYSFTGPAQRRYFAERGRLALATEAIATGQAGVDPERVDAVEARGRALAQDYFTADGEPDYAALQRGFDLARACDAKYGLPETPIPDEVMAAAGD